MPSPEREEKVSVFFFSQKEKKIGEGAVNHITPVKKSYCIVQLDMITVSALFGATRWSVDQHFYIWENSRIYHVTIHA